MTVLRTGYLKLYRKMLDWEWYQDANTMRLFLHLLLTVNITDDNWMGCTVPAGARIASAEKLANELGLSEGQIRTALNHLITSGEITRTSQKKFTLITVVRWLEYQTEKQMKTQPISRQKDKKIEEERAPTAWSSSPDEVAKREESPWDYPGSPEFVRWHDR